MKAAMNPDTTSTVDDLVSRSKSKFAELRGQRLAQYEDTVERAQQKLRDLTNDLADLTDSLGRNARGAVRRVDDFAHDNPWKTAGTIAAVAALAAAIAVLIARRD